MPLHTLMPLPLYDVSDFEKIFSISQEATKEQYFTAMTIPLNTCLNMAHFSFLFTENYSKESGKEFPEASKRYEKLADESMELFLRIVDSIQDKYHNSLKDIASYTMYAHILQRDEKDIQSRYEWLEGIYRQWKSNE